MKNTSTLVLVPRHLKRKYYDEIEDEIQTLEQKLKDMGIPKECYERAFTSIQLVKTFSDDEEQLTKFCEDHYIFVPKGYIIAEGLKKQKTDLRDSIQISGTKLQTIQDSLQNLRSHAKSFVRINEHFVEVKTLPEKQRKNLENSLVQELQKACTVIGTAKASLLEKSKLNLFNVKRFYAEVEPIFGQLMDLCERRMGMQEEEAFKEP